MTYTLVDTPTAWEILKPRLFQQTRVAVDLECDFDRHRYGKRLCLVQLALDTGEIFILDPLALKLEEFWIWMENPEVEKVFFGAQSDVKILKWDPKCHIKGVVDLFEAARLLGTEKPNLPLLVQQHLGKTFEKDGETQVSDWNQRPLLEAQLHYAGNDVVPLLALWDKFKPQIFGSKKEKLWKDRMCGMEALEFTQHEKPWLRVSGIHLLATHQQILLKYFYLARDEVARRCDLASYLIMEPSELIELCQTPPDFPYSGDLPAFPGMKADFLSYSPLFWFALRLGLEEIHQFRRDPRGPI